MLKDTKNSVYQPGQVWSYHSRPGEEKSRLVILKVEEVGTDKKVGTIVHVYVDGISLKNAMGQETTVIPHVPFDEGAIDKSVIALIRENISLPNFKTGYEYWRTEFIAGKAAVFNTTVADAINSIQATVSTVK